VNWKGSGRKQAWPNRGTITEFVWRDWGRRRKTSVRIANVLDGITTITPNVSSERYHYTNLLGFYFRSFTFLSHSSSVRKDIGCELDDCGSILGRNKDFSLWFHFMHWCSNTGPNRAPPLGPIRAHYLTLPEDTIGSQPRSQLGPIRAHNWTPPEVTTGPYPKTWMGSNRPLGNPQTQYWGPPEVTTSSRGAWWIQYAILHRISLRATYMLFCHLGLVDCYQEN
jgi:hypothetical protein